MSSETTDTVNERTDENATPSTREGSNTNRRNANRGNRRNNTAPIPGTRNFAGETPELDAVIGLLSEKLDKGVTLEQLQEKLKNYALKNLDKADDIIILITDFKDPNNGFESKYLPTDLTTEEEKRQSAVKKWEIKYRRFLDREETLRENINKLYALIMGQCTTALRSVIKGDSDFESKSRDFDALWLLEKVKKISAGVDANANPVLTLHEQLLIFLNIRQGQTESDDNYLTRFNSKAKNLELAGGEHIFCSPTILGKSLDTASPDEIKKENERFRAICFIQRADETRYSELLEDLRKGVFRGRDEYPETVSEAYELLIRTSTQFWYVNRSRNTNTRSRSSRNFTFTQNGGHNNNGSGNDSAQITAGKNGETFPDILCYACRIKGHYADQCPSADGTILAQVGVILTQQSSNRSSIKKSWILLDTCSTHSVTNNSQMVTDIRKCHEKDKLMVATNGGSITFASTASFKFLPLTVFFNPNSMATILSMRDVANIPGVQICMDTNKERAIFVFFNGKTIKFQECASGLYFYDTVEDLAIVTKHISETVIGYSALQTTRENKQLYTKDEILRADKARKYQGLIAWPSTSTFKKYVSDNYINNCDVTVDDIERGILIYGEPLPLLKGKMKRISPRKHPKLTKRPLPFIIAETHRDLNLYVDIMYVNGLPFLISKSGKIIFLASTFLKSRSAKNLLNAISRHCNKYENRGFKITDVHGNNEFDIESLI